MNEINSTKKQYIAIKLNMKFNEIKDLFSEDTLNSMRMEKVLGGSNNWNTNIVFCMESNCAHSDCHCSDHGDGDKKGISCVSLDLPSLPPTPTLTKPSSSLN